MKTSNLWRSFQLRDAAKQLYNFVANQLYYAAKRLCSKMTGHYKLNLKNMLSSHI